MEKGCDILAPMNYRREHAHRSQSGPSNHLFYGSLAIFLLLVYGGAAFLGSVHPSGRPLERAADIAVPVLIGAFVGRKWGIGWGVLVVVTIAAFAQIGSL
jgi:hypothetical protein